jgi:hypothetical protein
MGIQWLGYGFCLLCIFVVELGGKYQSVLTYIRHTFNNIIPVGFSDRFWHQNELLPSHPSELASPP